MDVRLCGKINKHFRYTERERACRVSYFLTELMREKGHVGEGTGNRERGRVGWVLVYFVLFVVVVVVLCHSNSISVIS